jgi:hypothetical protein
VVLWCPKERSRPRTRLGANPGAAEAVAVAVAVVAALRQQQGQRESLVEGVWVLVHEVVGRLESPESQKQEGPFWIEKSKSVRRWHPWQRNRVAIQREVLYCWRGIRSGWFMYALQVRRRGPGDPMCNDFVMLSRMNGTM